MRRTPRHLRVTTHRAGPVHTIRAEGHIDLATDTAWHNQLMDAATADGGPTHLVVDLTAATHLSWASTAALVRAHHACTDRRRHLTVVASGSILTGLRLTRVDQTVDIAPGTQTTRTTPTHNYSEWLIA